MGRRSRDIPLSWSWSWKLAVGPWSAIIAEICRARGPTMETAFGPRVSWRIQLSTIRLVATSSCKPRLATSTASWAFACATRHFRSLALHGPRSSATHQVCELGHNTSGCRILWSLPPPSWVLLRAWLQLGVETVRGGRSSGARCASMSTGICERVGPRTTSRMELMTGFAARRARWPGSGSGLSRAPLPATSWTGNNATRPSRQLSRWVPLRLSGATTESECGASPTHHGLKPSSPSSSTQYKSAECLQHKRRDEKCSEKNINQTDCDMRTEIPGIANNLPVCGVGDTVSCSVGFFISNCVSSRQAKFKGGENFRTWEMRATHRHWNPSVFPSCVQKRTGQDSLGRHATFMAGVDPW